jgi:hypothetical protein
VDGKSEGQPRIELLIWFPSAIHLSAHSSPLTSSPPPALPIVNSGFLKTAKDLVEDVMEVVVSNDF